MSAPLRKPPSKLTHAQIGLKIDTVVAGDGVSAISGGWQNALCLQQSFR
jgi:hypothetical protein